MGSGKIGLWMSLAVAVLVLSGIVFVPAVGKQLTIRGQGVQLHGANPLTIKGSFYIGPSVQMQDVPGDGPVAVTIPWQTIKSHGTGGACLIADLNARGIPALSGACSTDEACIDAIPPQFQGNYTDENGNEKARDWHSYCVEGRCWTRPGPQTSHCLISPIHNSGAPWSPGSHVFGPPPISSTVYTVADLYHELGSSQDEPVSWRVRACLNGSAGIEIDNAACAGADGARLVHDGPPSKLP